MIDPEVFGAPEWLRFAGRLHPLVLHLPIGLFAAVVLVELLGALVGEARGARRVLYLAFGASSALAAFTGWRLGLERASGGELLDEHRLLGFAAAGVAVVAAALEAWARGRGGAAARLVLLAACGALLGAGGHRGGMLTHGQRFLSEAAPPWLAPWVGPPARERPPRAAGAPEPAADRPAEDPAGPEPTAPAPGAAAEVAALVEAFRERCFECHREAKAKGGLRLDLAEGWVAGADPDDVEWSELVYRVALPADDADAMPPEGARLDPATVDALRGWIGRGADPAELEGHLGGG